MRISAGSAVRIMQRKKQTGGVMAAPHGRPCRSKLDAVSDWLKARFKAEPDITLLELADALKAKHDLSATSAIRPMLGWQVDRKIAPHIPVIDKAGRTDGTWTRDDFGRDAENNCHTRFALSFASTALPRSEWLKRKKRPFWR